MFLDGKLVELLPVAFEETQGAIALSYFVDLNSAENQSFLLLI